jgi:tRNA A37 methylthiotransferase MiaB
VPVDVKRARLNELLAVQEAIGLERNRAWVGRDVEVLVDAVTPPRSHDHEADEAGSSAGTAPTGPTGPRISGRSREHKLVHLTGDPALVGRLVHARIEQAGPYALRGVILGA